VKYEKIGESNKNKISLCGKIKAVKLLIFAKQR
jgi:hypothetical protein